jgi:predicted ATPase/DNA-binding CsgD family transcriptional regulator
VPCPAVVGRAHETEVLTEALTRALDHEGAFIFVVGEAGIGKSRLVNETTALAAKRGARVLRGRALPGSMGTAYRPLAEALLPVIGDLHDDGGELAGWLSVLSAILPIAPAGQGAEVGGPVAGEAVIQVLRWACRPSGGVMVLEDLHWADPETVALVEHLSDNVGRAPVLCLVTVRSEEAGPARDLVRRVRARRSASVLELERLNEAQVAAMVHWCGGDDARERATTLGEGIPFLIEELLVAPGVPTSFLESVGARLATLDEDDRRVLRAASAFGRHFDWRLLAGITGDDPAAIVDALERGIEVQLLSVEGDGFRFRHALTAEAVFRSMSPPRREALAAAALKTLDAEDAGSSSAGREIAARLAERAGQRERAGRLHLESAEDALARSALHTAASSLERAVELLDDLETRTRAQELLVDALARAGRVDDTLSVGADLLATLAANRAAAVHVRLAESATSASRWKVAAEHLTQASRLLDHRASPQLRASLAIQQAELALGTSELGVAELRAREAMDLAIPERLADCECASLQLLGRVARRSSLELATGWFRQGLEVAERHGLTMWRQRALYELGTISLLDRSEVEDLLAAQRLAGELGAMATVAVLDLEIAAGYAGLHDLDAQARHAESAIRRGTELGLDFVVAFAWHFVASAAILRGDREGAAAAAEASREVLSASRDIAGLLVGGCDLVGALLDEDRRAARELAAACAELLRGSDTAPPMHLRAAWPLLLAVDHEPAAMVAVEELEGAGVAVSRAGRGGLEMARAIVVGWFDPETAAARARNADSLLSFVPWWRHVVRRLTAEAASADGWSVPEGWMAESEAWFRAEGYHRLAGACRRLAGSAPEAVPVAWVELGITRREAEVLGLVIEGLSNKDIAQALSLSVRTIEKHVESLLRKTGTARRTQLARIAVGTT